MNTVNIAGKIIEDPVKSTSSSGIKLAKLKLAVDKHDKEGKTNGDDSYEIIVFRELADLNLKAGQYIGVSGKLTANNYDKDGKVYYNCSIVGNSISLLGN